MAGEASEVGFAIGTGIRHEKRSMNATRVCPRESLQQVCSKPSGKNIPGEESRTCPQLGIYEALVEVGTVLSLATLDEFLSQHMFHHPFNLRHERFRVKQCHLTTAVSQLQSDFVPAQEG